MLAITGDTYDVRDQLKALGCRWDEEQRLWLAPDEGTRAQGQSLADAEPWRKWRAFMDTLAWVDGSFTTTAFDAGLNACSRGIPLAEAMKEIRARIEATGKAVEAGWIERNIGRAYERAEPPAEKAKLAHRKADTEDEARPEPKKKPEFAQSKLAGFAGTWAQMVDATWLADRSPVEPAGKTAGDFLAALYQPGEHVVVLDVFESQGQWVWSHEAGFAASRVDYHAWDGTDGTHETAPPMKEGKAFAATGAQGIWYLCNPVNGVFRKTGGEDKRGRPQWSRRWEACVTSWRYFVFESDEADPREWVGAIVQLPLPIAAIYTSGGGPSVRKPKAKTSVHVLVRVDASSKAHFDLMRETAKRTMIPLGADKGCMSAVRLTRLPGCVRECDKDGAPWPRGPQTQKLLYLDPRAGNVPLVECPALRDTRAPWVSWCEAMVSSHLEDADPDEVERLLRGLAQYRASPWARRLIDEVTKWRSA